MPSFGSQDDAIVMAAIERWRMDAQHSLEDIRGWRGHTDERAALAGERSRYWGDEPKTFSRDTYYLCGWIGLHHPHLDTAPLQDIYDAVKTWFTDRDDAHVVDQRVLDRWLERAMAVLLTVDMAIQSRVTRTLAGTESITTDAHSIKVTEVAVLTGLSVDTIRRRLKAAQVTLTKINNADAATLQQYEQAMRGVKDGPYLKLLQAHFNAESTQ